MLGRDISRANFRLPAGTTLSLVLARDYVKVADLYSRELRLKNLTWEVKGTKNHPNLTSSAR